MRRAAHFAVAALLAVVLAGCLGRSPSPTLYTLEAAAGAAVPVDREIAFALGPVRLPRHLDSPRMVVRLGSRRVAADGLHRWAGGLGSNVARSLGAGLAQRLGTSRVAVQPAEPAFPLDYRVIIDFDELVVDETTNTLELDARWVVRPDRGDAVAVESTSVRRADVGTSVEARIDAHEAALGELADAIALRLAALAAAPAGAP